MEVKNSSEETKHWYVMLHLEPEHIEHHLQQENEERQRKGRRLYACSSPKKNRFSLPSVIT